MKKVLILLLILVIGFGSVVFAAAQAEKEDVIKVGFYGPLSGPMSLSGIASRQGTELAIKQLNDAGGVLGKKLVLFPYDDKSSPEQAVKAVTRMIESDKVHVIVGSLHSGNTLAQGPVGEKAKIPQIAIGTSPTWLEQGFKYHFRCLPNTHIINVEIARTIDKLGLKKIGGLGRSDEYGKTGIEDVRDQLSAKNIPMTAEWFQPGDTDFTGQLTKLINSGIDGLIAYGVDVDQGPIMKQARRLGFTGLVFGPESMNVPSVKEVAGKDADGAIYGSAYVIPDTIEESINQMHKDFFTAFVAEFGAMPESQVAMRCYDAVNLLAEAIRRAGSLDGTAIRDQLDNLYGVEGLAGTFDFRGNHGEGILYSRMFAIKDGKDILLEDYLASLGK
jgi:branched-chain amino acid transport system substrate-binding protein